MDPQHIMCDHDHEGGCCGHGDGIDESNSIAYSLYEKIDLNNLECLNESVDGSGLKVFKSWSERLNTDDYVESDCDAELIFNIPFTGDVKIKGIIVIASDQLHKMRLFKTSLRKSFDDICGEADQEFEVAHDPSGLIEYPVKPTKFFNVHRLAIHFVNRRKEDDNNPCRIYYIGLRGEFTPVNRDGIVIANYEIRPTEGITEKFAQNSREIQ